MTEQTALSISGSNEVIVQQALDQKPAAVYLASLSSPQSRRTMRQALEVIASLISSGQHTAFTLHWGALRSQHTAAIRAALDERYARATVNKMPSGLRRVLETACNLGQITADECRTACNIKAVKGEALPAGRELAFGEIQAMVAVCKADAGPAGIRDAALIGVLYTCGLRRAEL